MMSIRAASTPASLSFVAMLKSTTPVCTTTVKPSFRFTSGIASTNLSNGTDPSGRQPPLIRQPIPPFRFTSEQTSINCRGVKADNIVLSTLPPQCLHFKAQKEPVTEMEGKAAGDEQKQSVL